MIKVIIVEDDPMVREINIKFLSKVDGFQVVGEASNIEGAKSIINNIEANLILLDVFLPDGKGLDLLKWIRLNEIQVDTILVTADKGRTSVDEAFKYGAVDYLIKPFKYERFKEALSKYRERFNRFKKLDSLDQEIIDEYIFKTAPSNKLQKQDEVEINKGLNIKTYNKIVQFMKGNKEAKLTAEEIANGSGLARVTARRYLEKMGEEGKVDIVQEYGRIGRPTNFYIIK
ncbi:response regulator [Clostridium gasigenes]|uniref:response regulator n=1 Tax=Clostridium gasigenes TaxID=94869 RepID=UPI001C0CD9D3|nr:response regulator [Clostridium gasigenes]MBU3134759.1 response regulator [Clostridium gasigenes]